MHHNNIYMQGMHTHSHIEWGKKAKTIFYKIKNKTKLTALIIPILYNA